MATVMTTIRRRILGRKGWVFTPKDFLDLGSRAAVDKTLTRLAQKGVIRRLDRGMYDYPVKDPMLGVLSPNADKLAAVLASKMGDRLFPSGATAANLLGLSTQVPGRVTYMTDGASRVRKVAGRTITFKHARTPILSQVPDKVNYTLQALAYLGKTNIDDAVIRGCAKQLDDRDVKALLKAKPFVSGWIADAITRIESAKHGSVRA
jgi:predicted transcriptional regulator of viral defense system